jgi:hypothetical protein
MSWKAKVSMFNAGCLLIAIVATVVLGKEGAEWYWVALGGFAVGSWGSLLIEELRS